MLKIINYSDKSIVVTGDGTKTHKDRLKELGGKYNSNLTGGAGWIFSKKATEKVQSFLDTIGQDREINSTEVNEPTKKVKRDVSGLKNFCSSLSKENISEARKAFTELDPVAQKLFLHWGWEILSHKSKYPEDTYIVAYKLFRLFRGREGSSIPSYEKYSKMPLVDKIYSKASEWKKGYDKDSTPREEKEESSSSEAVSSKTTESSSRSRSRSSKTSRASRTSRTSGSSTSSRSRSGSAKASKKYDKEYQKYAEPESEIDPLYIYYTTLFQERPKSKLAITWLTEHGVFSDDQRDELVERYKKIKEG
jgi:hypothetical protein